MRILGIDYGEARIGVAVSDPLGITALPLPFIANDRGALLKLKGLIQKYGIEEIVAGLPRKMSGELGASAEKVKSFCTMLEKELKVRTVFMDERLTTKLVERAYHEAGTSSKKMRKNVDSSSACVILQDHMDSRRT